MTGPVPAAAADDPYQWLEEWTTPRAMEWVGAHNDVTVKRLTADPRYATLYDQALAIAGAKDRIPMPSFRNGEIYNFWQDETHLRGIWRKTSLADYRNFAPNWQTVLDIDALGKAEGKSWVWHGDNCLMPERRLCLINLSDGGEDAAEVREFDLATGKFVADGFHLPRGKHNIAWEDADHLLVATEWQPGELTTSGYAYVVKRLARGQSFAQAKELFRGERSDVSVDPQVLVDASGQRLALISRATDFFHRVTYVVAGDTVRRVAMPEKASIEELIGSNAIVRLDEAWGAIPAGSEAAVSLAQLMATPDRLTPTAVWTPGVRDALKSESASRNALVLSTLANVKGKMLLVKSGPGGWSTQALPFPENQSIDVVAPDRTGDQFFASAQGFTTPTTLYLVDAAKGSVDPVKSLPPKFNATGLVVDQFDATSSDGTKVPYFLVHRKDRPLDGNTPTLLNAYGGFQVSSTPVYSGVTGKLWLERGGAFVLANIRGGGEFGPKWHEAALKTRRQIAYDDFAAVAKDLIARKVTSPRRLGIEGGSNGGLLMGVEFTQHPELWNAVVIQVPLLDMIRIDKIAAGASWQGEYGDVNADPAVRAFWEKVSPYHQLKAGVKYPEPFIFTTTKDDRVGPQHARKFAAKMEGMGLPFMYYENTEGGHGSGADIKQSAKTNALTMTYLIQKLMD
ncbi:prolyl oligopeptidase family serine peptidase [Novosphingobium sp.]|uniref:prolyl oligopeptidase family serine peptidase n=1 Tax=Novosphingobium sp. TaxID=1874826 RepID=UPI0025E6B1D6|nr:prolyl oligopeptidase family serine peptidase [Novosphingobium sp.]